MKTILKYGLLVRGVLLFGFFSSHVFAAGSSAFVPSYQVVEFIKTADPVSSQISSTSSSQGTTKEIKNDAQKKDVSELFTKLSQRFVTVWNEAKEALSSHNEETEQHVSTTSSVSTESLPLLSPLVIVAEPLSLSLLASGALQDITVHPSQQAILQLTQWGIVSSQSKKFYPDNYLRRYELITMLVRALDPNMSDLRNSVSFADVDADDSYNASLAYAHSHGFLDYFLETKRGETRFHPNAPVTEHELYHVLGQLVGKNLVYDEARADAHKVTRAEFAETFVDLVGKEEIVPLHPSEETTTSDDANKTLSALSSLQWLLSKK